MSIKYEYIDMDGETLEVGSGWTNRFIRINDADAWLPATKEEQNKLIAAIVGEPVTVIRDSELPKARPTADFPDLVEADGSFYSRNHDAYVSALRGLAAARFFERQQAEQDAKNAERKAKVTRLATALSNAGLGTIGIESLAISLIDQGVGFPEENSND